MGFNSGFKGLILRIQETGIKPNPSRTWWWWWWWWKPIVYM